MTTYQIALRTLLLVYIVILCIGTNGSARSQPPHQGGSTMIFEEVPLAERQALDERARTFHESSGAASKNYKSTVVRSDYIRLDWDQMIAVAKAVKPTILRLFKDLTVEYVPKRFEKIPQNPKNQAKKERFRWSGAVRVKGQEIGQIVFAVNLTDKTFSGTIRYQNKAFRIQPLGNDRYEVMELKVDGFPDEASPLKQDRSQSAPSTNHINPDRTIRHDEEGVLTPGALDEPMPMPTPETTDAPCPIDVMILYTKEASAATPDIEGEIFEAIIQSNDIFERSNGHAFVQATFWSLIDLPEGEFKTIKDALYEIGNDSTTRGGAIKTLRGEWKADLVSLWVENSGKNEDKCGIGYQSDSKEPSEIDAFTVVRRDCTSSQGSFAHELGHNLGMGHDHYDQIQATGRDDEMSNHGHVSLQERQTTMMATNKECQDKLMIRCERLPLFSSPNFFYPNSSSREPMGIPAGKPDAADNADILRNNACKIAIYR